MGNETLSCVYSFPLILNVDFSHVPFILNADFSHVPLKIPRGRHCPMHAKTHQDHWAMIDCHMEKGVPKTHPRCPSVALFQHIVLMCLITGLSLFTAGVPITQGVVLVRDRSKSSTILRKGNR